eukprot:15612959-Heterocapsa_arctica.AAC.1
MPSVADDGQGQAQSPAAPAGGGRWAGPWPAEHQAEPVPPAGCGRDGGWPARRGAKPSLAGGPSADCAPAARPRGTKKPVA